MSAVEETMCGWVIQRGHSGDGCELASTLCKYDLKKGYLFVFFDVTVFAFNGTLTLSRGHNSLSSVMTWTMNSIL